MHSANSVVQLSTTYAALTAMDRLRIGLQPIAHKQMFCTWRLEENPGKPDKPRKVPYVSGGRKLTGSYAAPELPAKLMILEEAIAECLRLGHQGVGVVFTPDCGVIGVDFDHCLDAAKKFAGTLSQKTALATVKAHAFIERSQSGTGLHAIVLGNAPTAKANGELEVFGDKNFLALTGEAGQGVAQVVDGVRIAALLQLVAGLNGQKTMVKSDIPGNPPAEADSGAPNTDLTAHIREPVGKEPIERVADALRFIDPNIKRDVGWRSVIWGIRHGLGCTTSGEELAVNWSSGAIHDCQPKSYIGPQDVASVFHDYDGSREGAVTVGTLYHLAKLGGWQDDSNRSPTEATVTESTPGDIANGKFFARQVHGKLVRNSTRGQWLYQRDGVWLLCERGEEVGAAKLEADRLLNAVLAYKKRSDFDEDRAKKWLANAMRLQGLRGLEAMIQLSTSEPGMSEPQTAFDADPWMLCVRNGVVDLKSGQLLPHDPGHLMTRRVEADYQVGAKCPLFDKFMNEIFMGDAATVQSVQRFLGYSLTGVVSEEKFAFAYGAGANGKSVLANVLTAIMGTYCMTAPASMLEVQATSGGARSDVARLAGARLVLANETNEGRAWDSQVIKQIVSTERIAARFVYGEFFEFQPTAKVIVRGNHKPTVHDSGDGMWRRLDLWPFERQFAEHERDTHLVERLLAERDGILRWLVEGCMLWQKSGLQQSLKIRDASLSYRSDCDVVGQWIDERCEQVPAAATDTATLYSSYSQWSAGCGLHPMSRQTFGRRLAARGLVSTTSNSVRRYLGIQIRRGTP